MGAVLKSDMYHDVQYLMLVLVEQWCQVSIKDTKYISSYVKW